MGIPYPWRDTHNFIAQAMSRTPDFGVEEIAPIAGVYSWAWHSWQVKNNIVTKSSETENVAEIKSGTTNGESTVTAELEISDDTIHGSTPPTPPKIISGSLDTEVFICENPWPGTPADPKPFVDAPSLYGENFGLTNATSSYGNFQTRYCRDFGAAVVTDDLPALTGPITSTVPGTLREFVFRNGADVIGFKIMENPHHVSPMQWYREHFTDSPEPTTVNGWQAVRRGNTIYVSAANFNTQLYSNIYVVSYNEGASAETKVIYDQLVNNLKYLVNVPDNLSSGFCGVGSTGTGGVVTTTGGVAVTCSNDQECLAYNSNSYCNAFDDKVKRDLVRLADFRTIEAAIMDHNSIPELDSGTFVRSHTTSAWPSWLETFSTELGTAMPADPINNFYGCSKTCSGTGLRCTENADCQSGQTCQGFASESCYDSSYGASSTAAYRCPAGSLVYQYHSLGNAYRLETDLENRYFSWGTFAPVTTLSGVSFALGNNNGSPRVCPSGVMGDSNICGDGVLGQAGGVFEVCERGQTAIKICSSIGVVGNGTISAVCKNDCSGWQAAVLPATCVQSYCGDGIIQSPNGAGANEICDDGANNGRYGYCNTTCTARGSYCGDGVLAGTEQCDLGTTRNGQWDYDRAHSCASDCTIPGPYCGNGIIESGEQCDGNVTYGKGLCVMAGQDTVANSAAECTAKGGTTYTECLPTTVDGFTYQTEQVMPCGTATNSCAFVEPTPACERIGSCGNGVKDGTEECDDNNNNNTDSCTEECKLNICGDEFPYTGVEDCDFGSNNGTPCSAAYGSSCNYCSTNCRYVTQAGAFCGDGIHTPGAEQCDFSANPIFATGVTPPEGYIASQSLCGQSCVF
ncbi:MAG: hypothetical protein UX39_C0032G0002 [Candidatus Magasanikbacteria bacterium GW2011_GWA2_46_17]|uniref:Uncharacterized protein n=1 Tax=Candidatus Magasanikbacteria bacterium GW2011_GWA2_46_17 TaxID=1619042 RepID=A0A0G1RWS6_9BACT|nr:MAG: hypothetical protein UX39_C0032G0002 [Candidatus Magasanikbacteria bacterium GW2011_GWA2_46_17]